MNFRSFGTVCVLVILRVCSPNNHRYPLLHVKSEGRGTKQQTYKKPKIKKSTYKEQFEMLII